MSDGIARDVIEAHAERLLALHRAVTALVPRDHERPEHAARLARDVTDPLRAALAETLDRVGAIEQACDVGDPGTGDWGDHLEHTGTHELPDVASTLASELWQQVGNLAFAARSELRRAERRLVAPGDDHDARVTACESARRKLRRAVHALLGAIGAALGRDFALGGLDVEVETAVSVRRLFAKFRRSLPPCDPAEPAQVRRALRFAAVSLAVMVGDPDFSELRAPDRQLLLQLQARILGWARAGASDAERSFARGYLATDGRDMPWALIRCAMASVADTCVHPMQDVLGLPSTCRMNHPGQASGWWGWRFQWGEVQHWHGERLAELARLYGR